MPTLYASADRTRFFHVPDDARLPEGDLAIRTLTGRRLLVDPVAAAVFEVSEAEATAIAQELLGGFADKLRALAMSTAEALSRLPSLDPAAVAEREARVAANLGMGREKLREDPAALGAAVKSAVQDMVKLAQEAVHAPEVAEERMKDVAEAMRQEGVDADTAAAMEALPGRLRALLSSPEVLGRIDAATADLRAAADELRAENLSKRPN